MLPVTSRQQWQYSSVIHRWNFGNNYNNFS